MLGLLYRNVDILTLQTGMKINGITYRISYGLRSVNFKDFDVNRGDLEFSVIINKIKFTAPSFNR